MKISHQTFSVALGVAATGTSTVLLVLQVVLAKPRSNPTSSTRITAIISAFLEASSLLLLSWLLLTSIRRDLAAKVTGLWVGATIGLCIVADAFTMASFICLASLRDFGDSTSGFLAGAAAVLVVAFVTQLLFLVARLLTDRAQDDDRSVSPGMQEIGRPSTTRVKTIPYSRTSPSEPVIRNFSVDSNNPSPPPSRGGFSATDTISSMASSLTSVVLPISSKTRLLSSNRSQRSQRSLRSQPSVRRPPSLESVTRRERSSSINAEESFDSWDTSGVDPQNRQTVLESSSPALGGRFLETIPASPTTSRSSSPATTLDYEPPRRQARRSRSFSPASTRSHLARPQPAFTTQHSSASESHIHPLFRSDSPTPPPLATPGTVVIAAPQAGQIISDRGSIRSLSRLRSGSLPAVSSPLTMNGSFESFSHINPKSLSTASDLSSNGGGGGGGPGSISSVDEGDETPERKITPPIPEFILNAGSRTSLHGYQVRKTHSRDGPSGPGLDALPPASTW